MYEKSRTPAAADHDVATPEHAVEMYRLLPHSRLAILPGAHGQYMGEAMFPDTDPKLPLLFVAMVNEFLAEGPSTPGH